MIECFNASDASRRNAKRTTDETVCVLVLHAGCGRVGLFRTRGLRSQVRAVDGGTKGWKELDEREERRTQTREGFRQGDEFDGGKFFFVIVVQDDVHERAAIL